MVCAVSFERYGRLYYFDPGPYTPTVGDKVLVPTDDGPEVAECVWAPQWVSEDIGGLPVLAGLAAPERPASATSAIRRRKAEARVAAKRLVREHELPMKVVGVDYVAGRPTGTTIYFSAPHRVDFRSPGPRPRRDADLPGRAAPAVRRGTRPGCRAASARADATCAARRSSRTSSRSSIRMAKDQDLPLNPLRISGACGRLLCCLKYEHPLYVKAHETVPARGTEVDTPEGPGRVVDINVPSETVKVRLRDGGRTCSCSFASVCGPRQAHDERYNA